MRDIKFRQWLPREQIFHYWGFVDTDSAFTNPVSVNYSIKSPHEQYTGLKDKNGKEIYEGDIVHIDWYDVRYIPVIDVVEWNNETASYDFGCGATSEVKWSHEVIGNIHQNPDLIRKER